MNELSLYIQHSPPHVGEILLEFYMTTGEFAVKEAAKKIGISKRLLSDVINGQIKISHSVALKLAVAFGTTTLYWLNIQSSYNCWHTNSLNENN